MSTLSLTDQPNVLEETKSTIKQVSSFPPNSNQAQAYAAENQSTSQNLFIRNPMPVPVYRPVPTPVTYPSGAHRAEAFANQLRSKTKREILTYERAQIYWRQAVPSLDSALFIRFTEYPAEITSFAKQRRIVFTTCQDLTPGPVMGTYRLYIKEGTQVATVLKEVRKKWRKGRYAYEPKTEQKEEHDHLNFDLDDPVDSG
jgi:hypothetical protein